MKNAFNKDILKSVTHSLGRFIAIAAIVALGTGFYAGLRMTAPDMKLAADQFYDGTALMDIRIVSTLGLTDDDIAALRNVAGVQGVMPAYETDIMGLINGEQYVIRVHSLPDAAQRSRTDDGVRVVSDDENYLNRPILVKGSWPNKEGECLLSADRVMNTPTDIGDTVQITEWQQDGSLIAHTYTITGYARSSYYATSSSMGTTSLGSGSIQQFMYVPETDFLPDLPYTEAFVAVAGADVEFSGSDSYRNRIEEVVSSIEALAPAREQERSDSVRSEAQRTLDEKRGVFEREKADANGQLDEAKQTLDAAAVAIAENETKLADAQISYDTGVVKLATQRASAESQLSEAQQQVADGRAQVEASRLAVEQGQMQLAHAWATWQQSADELTRAWARWQLQVDELAVQRAAWQQGMTAWQAAWDALSPDTPDDDPAKAALIAQKQQLDASKVQIDTGQTALDQACAQLEALQQQVDAGKIELDREQISFDQQKAAFDAAVAQVDQGARDLEAARSAADVQLGAAQSQLDDAATQIDSGRKQLEQGKHDYEMGLSEYYQKRGEADAQLSDARRQLDEAQSKIDNIANASWLIMDRDKNYGVVSFDADADRVDSIAAVFPFIFFLVAALVALTTMTRMVEEERVLIGTYKALGYGKARIASKYLLYAAIASIAGSVVGIAVLSQILPAVISKAYAIIYFVPPGPLPIDIPIASLAAGLGVGVTLIATWAAVIATLRERPAALLLPRAPKSGKRILLERIPFVWRHLSFSWKVTFRNLFRYKKRLVMTVIGIAGCTALMLTGFGLQDSIGDIIDKQYGELVRYNTVIHTQDDMTNASEDQLDALLDDTLVVSSSTRVQVKSMLAGGPEKADQNVSFIVAQNPEAFAQMVTLRTREGHDPLSLRADGVILSEKLAKELGVGVGDTVKLGEQDETGNATSVVYGFPVAGVAENYIYYYAYASPELYERITGKEPLYSTAYAIVSSDPVVRTQFSEDVRAIDGVKTVAFNDETIDAYRTMLSSVNLIVVVLVVAAAALAFIVLYNLTNINITERQREIATLKVLGFTPREVSAYIFREIMLLSALGGLVGLVFGVFLESFVVVTAEVNQVMFGRSIHVFSFGMSFFLTLVFTVLVMLVMRRKLRHIDMVESLKSNE